MFFRKKTADIDINFKINVHFNFSSEIYIYWKLLSVDFGFYQCLIPGKTFNLLNVQLIAYVNNNKTQNWEEKAVWCTITHCKHSEFLYMWRVSLAVQRYIGQVTSASLMECLQKTSVLIRHLKNSPEF